MCYRRSPIEEDRVLSGYITLRRSQIEEDKTKSGYITPALSRASRCAVLLHNPCVLRGSPIEGDKIRTAYITPALSEARKRAGLLRNPCVLGRPQKKGTKSEVAISPLASLGPEAGWYWFMAAEFSGVPNRRGQNQGWLHQPCLLGGAKVGSIAA